MLQLDPAVDRMMRHLRLKLIKGGAFESACARTRLCLSLTCTCALCAASEMHERYCKLVEVLWSRSMSDGEGKLPADFGDVVRTFYCHRTGSRSAYHPRSFETLLRWNVSEYPSTLGHMGASTLT